MENNTTVQVEKFIANAEATTAKVQIVKNDPSEISAVLIKLTDSEKVLISVNDTIIIKPYLDSVNPIFTPTKEEIVSVPLCVTDALYGIAETGSVIIQSDKGYSAYFSMLSNKHIVLLNASSIFERPRDLFEDENLEIARNKSFTFITGPSATADMGSLVRGVHGPEHLHIIIIS